MSTPLSDSRAAWKPEAAKFDRLMSDKADVQVKALPASDRAVSRSVLKDKSGLHTAEPSQKVSKTVREGVLNNEQAVPKPAEAVIDERVKASIMMLLSGVSGSLLPARSSVLSGSDSGSVSAPQKPAGAVIAEKVKASVRMLLSGVSGSLLPAGSSVLSGTDSRSVAALQIKEKAFTASERQVVADICSDLGLRNDLANHKTFTAVKPQTGLKESLFKPGKGMGLEILTKAQVNNTRDKGLSIQVSGSADKAGNKVGFGREFRPLPHISGSTDTSGDKAALKPVQGKPDINIAPGPESSNTSDMKPLKLTDDILASVQDKNAGGDVAGNKQDNTVTSNADNAPLVNREGVSFKVENTINTKAPAAGQPAERLASASALSDKIFTLTRKDQPSIGLSIEPEGLGKIDVQLSLDKGMINGQINAYDAAGKDMLEKNLRHIMDSLLKEGLNVGGFSVSLREKKGEMDSDNRQGGGESSPREVRAIEKSMSNNIQAGNGRVNIFI